ncbi:MAG: hypothetical protein LUD14_02650 [Clostridiales bacterium]|nr:hypothetical protein [Clostridiales bacterium]
MKESSKKILKEVLSEQMETEANAVPQDEEIRRRHTFSASFLEKMRALVKKQDQMEREKEGNCGGKPEKVCVPEQNDEQEENIEYASDEEMKPEDARYEEKQEEKESRVLTGFTEKLANRAAKRIMTACIVCVILLGAGVLGYQGLLRAGSSSSSDSASVMTAMDEAEEETAEEEIDDVTEESAEVTEDADADSGDDGEITTGGTGDGSDDSSETSGSTDEFGTDITLEGADMTVENVTDHSMSICLSNDTGGEFTYGEAYAIECYDEETNTWVLLEADQNAGFDEAAYILSDGEECTQEADWTDLYGSLEAGTYRVVKEVQSEADGTIYTLAVAFVVE